MGLKDVIENVAKSVTHAVENARDAASEATHHTAAEAEQVKRENADLSFGDKAKSLLNQAKHETLAEIDAKKRDLRDAS